VGILTAAYSDKGTKKETNQDSFCIKIAKTQFGKAVLGVICDGMGGLEQGEVASASVINAFSNWFEKDLPMELQKNNLNDLEYQWKRLIQEQNQRIGEFGRKNKIQLGTTLTAVFLIENKFMMIANVGDTRAYCIDDKLTILSEDHTVVAREVKRGNITSEQAKTDPRRNVLLQCIGASKIVDPEFLFCVPAHTTTYMLCSDGFRHVISENEIYNSFNPNNLMTEEIMEKNARKLVELDMQRGETDNITVLLIKIQEGEN